MTERDRDEILIVDALGPVYADKVKRILTTDNGLYYSKSGAWVLIASGGATTPHKATHVVGSADAFVPGDLLDATAKVGVRKNSAGSVFSRRRLNLIEGSNVTLTVVDDAVNEEVDVVVNAVPGGADTQLQFNSAGVFSGDAGLVWNTTTKVLSVVRSIDAVGPTLTLVGGGQTNDVVGTIKFVGEGGSTLASIRHAGGNWSNENIIFQFNQDNTYTVYRDLFTFSKNGTLSCGTASGVASGRMIFYDTPATAIEAVNIRIGNMQSGAGANSSIRFESYNTDIYRAKIVGEVPIANNDAGKLNFYTNNGTTLASRLLIDQNGAVVVSGFAAASVGMTIKGAASQSANLSEWQNSASSVIAKINQDGWLTGPGEKRNSAQFDKIDATPATVTGLSVNVLAGKTYRFSAHLFIDASLAGGSKYAIGGTATATAIIYEIVLLENATGANTISSRQTALGGSAGQVGTVAGLCEIKGLITVNTAGTLTVQFAQNAASGTSSVLIGSSLVVQEMP